MKPNIKYLAAFLILLAIETVIALYIRDNFIRPFAGDVLVIILLYCFVMIFWPKETPLIPLALFCIGTVVEIGQYFGLVEILHLQHNQIARIVLGTVFDFKDIICYGVGAAIILIWQQRNRWIR